MNCNIDETSCSYSLAERRKTTEHRIVLATTTLFLFTKEPADSFLYRHSRHDFFGA